MASNSKQKVQYISPFQKTSTALKRPSPKFNSRYDNRERYHLFPGSSTGNELGEETNNERISSVPDSETMKNSPSLLTSIVEHGDQKILSDASIDKAKTSFEENNACAYLSSNSIREAYLNAIKTVLSNGRVTKKEKPHNIEVARKCLLDLESKVEVDLPSINLNENRISEQTDKLCPEQGKIHKQEMIGGDTNCDNFSKTSSEKFRLELNGQKNKYLATSNITIAQHNLAGKALTYLGDYCARHQSPKPLYIAWEKMKEIGFIPRENALSTYLFVLGLGIDNTSNENKSVKSENKETATDLVAEVATFHDVLYKPTEKTIALRVKTLVEHGNPLTAERLLDQMFRLDKNNNDDILSPNKNISEETCEDEMRLRTCLPILEKYYGTKEGIPSALRLYTKMKRSPSVLFEPENYSAFLSALARAGCFFAGSDPVADAQTLGYNPSSGPKLFDALVQEMADDVLELSGDCAKEMRNGFAIGSRLLSNHDRGTDSVQKMETNTLWEVPPDCQLSPVTQLASPNEMVACRVSISDDQAICPRTRAKLRLIKLGKGQNRHVHDTLLNMANSQFESFGVKLGEKVNMSSKNKKKKSNSEKKEYYDSEYAGKELTRFAKWLDERDGDPFTVIIDGANVAYFGLGCINYQQLNHMVTTLIEMGENPLVIMPQKYVQEKFHLRKRYIQTLKAEDLKIMEELQDRSMMYIVPPRCLDDYYWMLSSVSEQTNCRQDRSLDVPTENQDGRWPGIRPLIVTNDQMRDHKLELLEPRLFRRWFSSHIVNYDFTPFVSDASEDRKILFSTADFFSREIQGNPSQDACGDIAWHFPVRDWDRNDRFCVRIPNIPT
mmetsp:Transcript_3917/g.5336  ORF Transcript_3917/g.5336 Transcript_3917/m.5336 type:complete len:839 (+) Transcript_3917:528-3044(+)